MLKIALGIIVAAALDKYLNSPPFSQQRGHLYRAACLRATATLYAGIQTKKIITD